MPSRNDLQSRLAEVLGSLEPNPQHGHDDLNELEKLLVRSHLGEPATLAPRELSVERATLFAPRNLPNDRQLRLSRLLETRSGELAQFRVFRREAPMSAPMLDLAAPAWGRGALARHTIGPLRGVDGRLFWFDFFPIIRLVPLYMAGDLQPAILFFERTHLLILDHITRRHTLVKSSLWIRADLLAAGGPAGGYVGLRIEGGTVRFSVKPVNVGGKLTMPAGSTCSVEVNVSPSPAAPAAAGKAGREAAKAVLKTPNLFSFELKAGHATPLNVGKASWKVVGKQMHFEWEQGAAPFFEPLLKSVVIPMNATENRFGAQALKSPFATSTGDARIERSGWTLPVSIIDINNPTEAAGSGGLAIQTGKGLTLSWRGLREGPIHLRKPWIAGGTGLILIVDPEASNIYAHQRLRLWKDEDSRFRSQLDLRYTHSFSVTYVCAATGSEMVLAQTDAEASIDRPVDVKGTPFPVRTRKSLVSLVFTDDKQFAFVYDDNILVDSLDPLAKWPVAPGEAICLAIRNALFTITPVNSLFLFAELEDDDTVSQATLMLGMGMYGLLPTLPDPYAANVTWLRAHNRVEQREARPTMLLVAAVAWTKAADEEPDTVSTSFTFAPLGTQQQAFATWAEAGHEQKELHAGLSSIDAARPGSVEHPNVPTEASFMGRQSNQRDWDRSFGAFENEQFALLDVSTNADQMGVSFAWFDERRTSDADLIFYKVYKPVQSGEQPAFPLQVQELDLSAQSRHLRAFTVPQISWEPQFNLTKPEPGMPDPPAGWNLYPNDGGPTRLFNNSVKLVPVAPIPVTEFLVKDFKERKDGFTGALFTLPFGLRAFAEFSRENQFVPGTEPARLGLFRPEYEGGDLKGALQLRADAPRHPVKSPTFAGTTFQLNNVLNEGGAPTYTTTLGFSVTKIFNNQFYYVPSGPKPSGVPLSRIDFCGYGANIFSHWEDPFAAIAATSKAYFDVFSGRTAQEVIQVRSLLYPWGVRVVRTITLTRASDAYVFRFDTGWQAETEGIYDFRYKVFDSGYKLLDRNNPYEFHPGLVKGVFKVCNIRDSGAVAPFKTVWNKKLNEEYLDSEGIARKVDGTTGPEFKSPEVFLQPVYFDADVEIEFVVSGAVKGRVPSRGMLGYVQLAPRGEPIPPDLFSQLLSQPSGSLGGPVDCVIDVGKSGQKMRLSRVDVNASTTGSSPLFVSAARGAMVLPKDGSWTVVEHNQGTGEVAPLNPQAAVPVIRRGKLSADATSTDSTAADLMRIANPVDIVQAPGANTRNYGLLQSTNTQKTLFRLPGFAEGVNELKSAVPDFADAYRLVNSKGIFPKIQDAEAMNLGAFKTKILGEGYKLVNDANPVEIFHHQMQKGPLFLVNEKFLKIYVEYENVDKNGGSLGPGMLQYGFDATAGAVAKQWLSKLNDIAMVVDLGSIQRLMTIKGKFDAEKGSSPGFRHPELLFHDKLKPLIDILQILAKLQTGDYKAAFEKGLDVAMSNSADSWTYAFHARQEIPVLRFPPPLLDSPMAPLRLEAHMAIGVYFNEALAIPSAPNQLIPSAGAFLEFGGSLSVMCASVGAATVYAVGSVDVRMAADIKTGPSLHTRFGFGAEIAVGLPVVGTVSVLYMVGVEIDLDTGGVVVAAFLLFRGRAELLGGIVTVQIQIEAKGIVKDRIGTKTEMAAQVTFGLDVSIFLVINLHFSKSWEESRQIA